MIPEQLIFAKHCGTDAVGHLKHGNHHPSIEEGTLERQVCFNKIEEGGDTVLPR